MYEDIRDIVRFLDKDFDNFERYFEKSLTQSNPNNISKESNMMEGDGVNDNQEPNVDIYLDEYNNDCKIYVPICWVIFCEKYQEVQY